MVDDLKIEISIEPPSEFKEKVSHPFEFYGTVLHPEFNKSGDVISYNGRLDNLFIKMVSGKVLVMNSLHKFYHGNNYSYFKWNDLQDCLQVLARIFGDDFWKARISKITAAVNFECEAPGIIERLISYGGEPMEPMRPRNSRLVYGKRFASTHYNVKVYDKAFEMKKEERVIISPSLRVEKEMRLPYFQKRNRNPIKIYTPADLLEPKALDFLSFELFDLIWNLGFNYGIDPMEVQDFHDATVVVFMGNSDFRKVLKKKSNYRTYKSHERRYEELREEFKAEDYNELLNNLLEKKVKILRAVEAF